MNLPNLQMDPRAQNQAWLTTAKPTFGWLIWRILIAVPLVIYKPVLALVVIPVIALNAFVKYWFANRSLKKMRARYEIETREHDARVAAIRAAQAPPLE